MNLRNGKKLYSPAEAYRILYHAFRALPAFRIAKGLGVLSGEFRERIMLAVTEVNGCALCSYEHTRMALESGMSGEEIHSLLNGELDDVPEEELPAILFAQHYADQRGFPSKKVWEQLNTICGRRKSYAVLSAVQIIMAGNAYGIPVGSFFSRIRKDLSTGIDPRSNIGYELIMILTILPFVPAACVHGLISSVVHGPMIDFD